MLCEQFCYQASVRNASCTQIDSGDTRTVGVALNVLPGAKHVSKCQTCVKHVLLNVKHVT